VDQQEPAPLELEPERRIELPILVRRARSTTERDRCAAGGRLDGRPRLGGVVHTKEAERANTEQQDANFEDPFENLSQAQLIAIELCDIS
jgi:hypothetical protein